MEILNVKDLTFSYPGSGSPTVESISLSLQKGEFAVLCGPTGSGKSTFLRMLKPEIAQSGKINGTIIVSGKDLKEADTLFSASKIGFVMQRPEHQIVTDKVWHELAFGLENLGIPSDEISRRIAETASYFGINSWFEKDTSELSGGQKQLLNLASVIVMQPEILILDEPTAQLDPIAASEFITALRKLNDDLALTVIIAEHRLEDVIPLCDRLIVMENGRITENGAPGHVLSSLRSRPELMCGMPAASRLYSVLSKDEDFPLTVRQGRKYIEDNYSNQTDSIIHEEYTYSDDCALEFKDVFFRYTRHSEDILRGMSLKIYSGEIFCILGGNGSGKTTALSAASGIIKPYSGKIKIFDRKISEYKNQSLYRNCLALLPQDVQTLFLKNTAEEELNECGADISDLPFDIKYLMKRHPYDLSGGEQQILAIAKILASDPKIILMDEPTKGLDAAAKQNIMKIMHELRSRGITIVTVTHDIEFAAECADRCAMFFGGEIVSSDTPDRFFSQNCFYTTAVSRMTKGFFKNAVTVNDAAELCRANSKKEMTEQ